MPPFATIHSIPGMFSAKRVILLGLLNGLDIVENPGFEFGKTNKSHEYLSKFPLGKIPALECADGFNLSESSAIARYVASCGPKGPQLVGPADDRKTQAKIQQWTSFADLELARPGIAAMVMFKPFNRVPYDAERYEALMTDFERGLRCLDIELSEGGEHRQGNKKFLVGEDFTMGDIAVCSVLCQVAKYFLDKEIREQYPSIEPYLKGITAGTPDFKQVFGPLELCEARVKAP